MPKDYQIDLFNLNIEKVVSEIVKGLTTSFSSPTLSVNAALNNSLSNWSIKNEQYKIYRNYSAI
jgi:hypothetical protein